MKKKLKGTLVCLLAVMFVFGTQMSVFAAPAIMPDGNLFDAEYYARNNPDVAAVFGNDVNALYQHYVLNGKMEGRKAYHPNEDVSAILNSAAYAQMIDASLLPTDSKYLELKTAPAGSYVTFGTYEQDNNLKNGKEPIEWLVLENDGESLLVVSKYVLDTQVYSTAYNAELRIAYPITWEMCYLRTWLNSTFYEAAFSGGEQMRVETTLVDNSMPQSLNYQKVTGGNNTYDKVFILSYGEITKYFPLTERYIYSNTSYTDYAPNLRVKPTAYATAQGKGVFVYTQKDADDTVENLGHLRQDAIGYAEEVALRTPWYEQEWIATTDPFGGFGSRYSVHYFSIRPAMRISIK